MMRKAIATLFLLALAVAIWILMDFPRVTAWTMAFWPEQALLLGLLAWWRMGANPILTLLLLVAVIARGILLVKRALEWLHTARSAAPAAIQDS